MGSRAVVSNALRRDRRRRHRTVKAWFETFGRINLKAYIRYPNKLIITSYRYPPYVSSLKALVAENLFFSRDPLVQCEDVILSLELFNLESDPMKSRNLFSGTSPESLRIEIGDRLGDLTHIVVDIVGTNFSLETTVQRALAQ